MGQTFTTYINAKRTGSVDQEFAQLEQRGARAFSNLQRKAEGANRAITGLTSGRGNGGAARSPISSAYLASFDSADAKSRKLAEAQARLARENSRLVQGLRTTGQTLQVVQGPLGPIAGRVNAAADAMVRLTGVTLGLAGAGAALFAYTQAANRFVEIRSKLAPLYDTQEQVNSALSNVYGIAQRARAGLEPIVDLYGRMKQAGDQFGVSQERVARLTELVAKSATLSGGTSQSREAGLYQFAQGFGSGNLAGDELKSVRENIPQLARELSLGLSKMPEFKGIDVSMGKLKDLAAEGKLTSEVIMKAMELASSDIEARFSKLPPTLGTAFSSLSNSATMFVGRFEEATGIVGTLAGGVMLLGNNLNQVVGILGGVAAGWAAVALAAKAKNIAESVQGSIAGLRAQQTAAKVALEMAVNQRTAIVQRTVALKGEQAQINANIAALERELAVQQQIAASAKPSAAIGLPGAGRVLGEAEQKAAKATRELNDERQRLASTTQGVVLNERKLQGANVAVDGATKAATKSTSLLKMGATSLLGAINPLGIAVALATTAFLEWAMAESEAEKNAKKVEDAQRKLAAVIDTTTGKIIEQNAALLARARLEGLEGTQAAKANYDTGRSAIAALGSQFQPRREGGASNPYYVEPRLSGTQQQAKSLFEAFAGGGTIYNLQKGMAALAKADPSLRGLADQVDKMGGDLVDSARKVETLRAELRLLAGATDDETKRRAGGDFSGGRAQGEAGSNRDLVAEAEALRKKLQDDRYAAGVQKEEQLARLEERRSKMSADDYVRERAQILATYDNAIQSLDKQDAAASAKAQREEERRQKAHERELARIEKENQARDQRTEKRQDLLGRWSDEPKAVVKAQHDIRELNDLVGKTMNGLAAITKDNPLGQGIYTQDMANGDAARIQEGLQRPYDKFMESRQRDLNVSRLILQGRDLEAQALQKSYDLYDSIGKVTLDQYQSILQSLTVEERINDALARRERLLAPLRDSVQNLRSDIAKAIEDVLGGGNPLKSGKAFLKSLMQQFNRQTAQQLAERITGGLDERVRDLMRGSVNVDGAIADYLTALNNSGSATEEMAGALNNAADAANNAAGALNGIAGAAPSAGGAPSPLGMAGASIMGPASAALSSILSSQIPASFYKQGVKVGSGVGDNVLFKALGSLGAVVTDNLRSQSTQDSYYRRGLTPARVSDHTRTDDAWDVRLPGNLSFSRATELVRKQAREMGVELVKAIDETQTGGTGRHAHYVFGGQSGGGSAVGATSTAQDAIGGMIGSTPAQVAVKAIEGVADIAENLGKGTSNATPAEVADDGTIVVTGTRRAQGGGRMPSQVEVWNKIGGDLGQKLDDVLGTKFFNGIGKQLGTALQGAQTGMQVSGFAKALGLKQSNTGAAIGGAAGGVIGTAIGGPLGGMIGSALGGLVGGTLGGLFKKTKKATSTVSSSGGEIDVGKAQGRGGKQKDAANQLGGGLGSAIQQIADMLDATIGAFSVSIGMRKDKFVVDPTGKGRTKGSGVLKFDNEEDAIQAALRDAIMDGAITGLSAASQAILRKGKDLNAQLNKVMVIESIPKRLMALKDPVRFAVDELNSEFAKMIAYLKEGGATAAQFAEAQELYDLERAKAIEQATSQSTKAIQDMLDQMLNSQQSPLNRRTVYNNAQEKLAGFASDVEAGKAVDTDQFLQAVQNFQDASRALNGSGQSFFEDFNYLVGLLNEAKQNVTAGQTASGDLPASPFDDAAIQRIITGSSGTTDAINNQTDVLGGLLRELIGSGGGGGYRGGALGLLTRSV